MASADLTFQEVVASELLVALPAVPQGANPVHGQSLPYIQFGQSEVADDYPPGHDLLMFIHVWSAAEGPHEAKQYQHAIRAALHDKQFERGGWQFNAVREQFAETLLDADKETWHGIQRFRARAMPI